jgi:hypothetical protein
MEVTFGYNPLELERYKQYIEAAAANPKLLNGLAVTATLNSTDGMFRTNPDALPRISAPATVSAVRGKAEAAARLGSLDPAHDAVAEGIAAIPQNGGARVQITCYEGDVYRAATRRSMRRCCVLLRRIFRVGRPKWMAGRQKWSRWTLR